MAAGFPPLTVIRSWPAFTEAAKAELMPRVLPADRDEAAEGLGELTAAVAFTGLAGFEGPFETNGDDRTARADPTMISARTIAPNIAQGERAIGGGLMRPYT
jgi:hypothetical protein